ncbi:glycosyl hydrolases family 31-domain-containing protein [Blakeslea trispora]|nr:glycosyl hydrolases family 31-domain-containing protein [Blakeslea trispora]
MTQDNTLSITSEAKTYALSQSFSVTVHANENYVSIQGRHNQVIWQSLKGAPFILSSLGEDTFKNGDGGVFRITEIEDGPANTTVSQTIERASFEKQVLQLSGRLGFGQENQEINYQLELKAYNEKQLEFRIETDFGDRILLRFSSHAKEDFYGFGEQFSYSTLKGQKVPVFVREQGIGRGEEPVTSILNDPKGVFGEFAGGDSFTTYCPVPQFVSTDNRSLFLKNSEYSSFDLREDDRVTVRVNSSVVEGRLIDGDDLLDLISEYTLYSGRMDPLPDWVSEGGVVGMQGGQEKVRKVIRDLQRHDTPIAAVWLQDWCGKRIQRTPNGTEFKRLWWNWESDDVLYPDWAQFVNQELKPQNIRTLAYVNTFLANVQSKPSYRDNFFLEAQQKGYLVKKTGTDDPYIVSSGPNFEAGILDLSNPDTVTWFKALVKKQIWDAGISGMMTDFGEYLPYHRDVVQLASGVLPEVYHNQFPQEWAKLHSELVHELGLVSEAVLFYRAGFTRTPGYINLMWAGDQNVAWDEHDGIKSAVTGMLSGGFSGFSITHSDIGGYTTISAAPTLEILRSKELLFRWMELSAFTAVFRTHEGIIPELNAQFYDDEESLAYYAYAAKLYKSLSPYRRFLIQEAHTKGWPLMRHLVLYYPHDPIVRQIKYTQYLLGKSLLVVPMLSPGGSHVKAYLPKEEGVTWRHVWTNQSYTADGQEIEIESPFKKPAVLIREPREDDGLLDDFLTFVSQHS